MCYILYVCIIFFFKQKTAYEMRISDWSSDVCSSDLLGLFRVPERATHNAAMDSLPGLDLSLPPFDLLDDAGRRQLEASVDIGFHPAGTTLIEARSEEHTSELQSLMRSSYAVFCLKKNKHTQSTHHMIPVKMSTIQTIP